MLKFWLVYFAWSYQFSEGICSVATDNYGGLLRAPTKIATYRKFKYCSVLPALVNIKTTFK
jgi:hypothetical protein